MKKVSFFLFILLFLSFSVSFTYGELATEYKRSQTEIFTLEESSFPAYFTSLIQFLIVASISITVISLIKSGVLWITSGGNPIEVKEGKERLISGTVGLVIILSSFVFLSTVNPELVETKEPEVVKTTEFFPPGIYLSKKENIPEDKKDYEDYVHRVTASSRNLEEKGAEIKTVRIANQLNEKGEVLSYYYGVILHEEPAFRGRCEFFINDTPDPMDFPISGDNISSITVMRINKNHPLDGMVKVYEQPDFREDYPFENLELFTEEFLPLSISEVWSMNIRGSYAVLLSSGRTWEEMDYGCGVFLDFKPISDLKEHHMNQCNPWTGPPWFRSHKSCTTDYAIFPLLR